MGEAKRKEISKAELFAKEPERFFHESEIIMAVLKGENDTMMTCHGGVPRIAMEQALTRLTYKTMMIFQHMDMKAVMKVAEDAKPNIIVPGQGGINGN